MPVEGHEAPCAYGAPASEQCGQRLTISNEVLRLDPSCAQRAAQLLDKFVGKRVKNPLTSGPDGYMGARFDRYLRGRAIMQGKWAGVCTSTI